jgi:transcriptional regulator with XRE-family HTH domain
MNLQARIFLQMVGLRIRRRREAQGLTQAQLGERCQLHRTFIGSVERGERNVSILNLRTIASALRMPSSELLTDERGGDEA